MDESDRDRTFLMKGAKDIAKEAKRQAVKKVNKVVDRASDEYSRGHAYSRFQDEDEEGDGHYGGRMESDYTGQMQDEEGSSDATEGHDDEDEIYEGEYQGIPMDTKLKDGQVALGQPLPDSMKDRRELESERQADEEELAQQYELIIQECGHGRFQWQLFFTLGLALMSDGVEVFVVGFVLPSAETDMCVPDSSSGWLGSIVYLGMMIGAFFWGGMADKVGRRQCLLICMSLNGFFAFLSSFVQGYGFFLVCRMIAGFGIGGAVPIVFSYFAEVLAREKRGEHLSWLCMFWMIGEIYASAMAWAIIPHYGWSFSMGSAYQFHSWRVFVVVCALPCVCAVVALTFMPESPRFYLEVGKHDEAWMILKQIHDTNMRARGQPEKVFTVNRIKIPKQIDDFVEMQNESGNFASKFIFRVKTELYGIWLNLQKCFIYPVKDNTVKLAIVWFTLSFGYYGLSVWFPDVIKHLQADEYASKVKIHTNERIEEFTFNFTLENQIHTNGLFVNDRFISMKFKSVTFINSTFISCVFDDITSVGSYFRNCTFIEAFFFNTGFSMILSGISCFFLWFGTSESMMIGMLCLYNGLSISAWNSLDVVTTELYPTDRRGTGFGFCNALCKLAAVLGNLIFGSLVGITKAIPILLASSVLVGGGLVGLRLPDTRSNVLM
ncbi:synaptic vesicle glycoprotein 2Ca isoform X2 [Chanos chanos]|uniref:Synaptic vesicle glycoprotein 2Ca isoform X2 n=1 Tax=Chanos chanos TaxID=29144 RepID=A0A6J2WT74_CHACN|nr:synaptic vesicle glycoprotein 2C-like isoform X2 [Chanos chanos]